MRLVATLGTLAGRYFALWVLAGAALGAFAPGALAWVGPHVPTLLGVVMFGMGMTLRVEDVSRALSQPRHLAIGVAAQYAIMPLTAYVLAALLRLPPELAVGVILVGTCPGGTASNVVTYLARGDVAFSVAMTTVSTLLAPVLTPLLTLWLAGQWIPVPATSLLVSILEIVLLPVALGLLAHRYLESSVRALLPALPLISVGAIVLIVGYVVGASSQRIAETALSVFTAVFAHNLAGLGLGYALGRWSGMTTPRRRALALEVGMQNSGLAVTLATLHFNPVSALPGAVFSLWHNVTGPLLATYWSRRRSESG